MITLTKIAGLTYAETGAQMRLLWTPVSRMTELALPAGAVSGVARAISARGEIVGSSNYGMGTVRATLWR